MQKKIFRRRHLWLGILSAIPVFMVCLTGAFYVFKDEVEDLTGEGPYAGRYKEVPLPDLATQTKKVKTYQLVTVHPFESSTFARSNEKKKEK